VLASGGVAFLSKTLGCDVNTGDGLLMAAEVGASLSGMEFSAQYGICPAYSSVTKGLPYNWATFSDEAGNVLSEGENRMMVVANGLRRGPVYAVLDKAEPDVQRWLREGQPNCFLPHDRLGIDPFRQRFPVTLRCEGTVRGTGGIRLVDTQGRTEVPGLFAAGDAASREWLVGARTGGGAPNAAWAIASGSWAGTAAAEHSLTHGVSEDAGARRAGDAGQRPSGSTRQLDVLALSELARGEMLPIEKNLFRSEDQLRASLAALDAAYEDARAHLLADGVQAARARQTVALLVSARFAYRSALARNETRGLHRRLDRPAGEPKQAHHLVARGVDRIEVSALATHGAQS
jgi:succinate dehydrogenase/fumarate reductase flavoprotein subunit